MKELCCEEAKKACYPFLHVVDLPKCRYKCWDGCNKMLFECYDVWYMGSIVFIRSSIIAPVNQIRLTMWSVKRSSSMCTIANLPLIFSKTRRFITKSGFSYPRQHLCVCSLLAWVDNSRIVEYGILIKNSWYDLLIYN